MSIEEKSRRLTELNRERKKFFAAQRVEAIRNKPPTKTQRRNQMIQYLKNMEGYSHAQLKDKSFNEVQKLFIFEKHMKWINSFVPIEEDLPSEKVQKEVSSEKKVEGNIKKKSIGRKRAKDKQEQESSKRQRLEDDKEEEVLKKCFELAKEEEIAINAIPLTTNVPVVGFQIHIRVKAKHRDNRPEEDFERVLWGDLRVMFKPNVENEVWRSLQGYKIPEKNIKCREDCWDLKSLSLNLLLLRVNVRAAFKKSIQLVKDFSAASSKVKTASTQLRLLVYISTASTKVTTTQYCWIKTSPSNAIGQAHTSEDHGLSKKAQGNGYFALILLSEEAQRCHNHGLLR
ncbi:hypothetical protein Tco_0001861 [Tanacetum coccineum]